MRRGFSLIELLVVLAVMLLMIALLLPAVSGVRESSRRVKCAAQLQQLGAALVMYADSNREHFPVLPHPRSGPRPGVAPTWYGGLAGFFSLRQVGDGEHTGFGGMDPNGASYDNGERNPVMSGFLSSFEVLTCPSDKEDRWYASGSTSFAQSVVKSPRRPATQESVVSYNISYLFHGGFMVQDNWTLIQDETNGPDIDGWAWYGAGTGSIGAATPNSQAAGAQASGRYAPSDNHGAEGGHMLSTSGDVRFEKDARSFREHPQRKSFIVD
jgi:prepilin-type N-terminal cleavage/methylation domain-containing protein